MLSPINENLPAKGDNFYSIRVQAKPNLKRYREFDERTFGSKSNFVSTEKFAFKGNHNINVK